MSEIISAVIGAVVGFFASLLALRFSYKQLFAETVSKNRMDWINVWRENVSKFLACAELIIENQCGECILKKSCAGCNGKDCKIIEYKKEFYEARTMITSRLNLQEDLHVLMLSAINKIDYTSDINFNEKKQLVLEIARKILKDEWERVKKEARGKRK